MNDTVMLEQKIPINSSFKSIKIYDDLIVYLAEGDKNEIVVKDINAAKNVKFKVDENELTIRSRTRILGGNKPVKIILMIKGISCITLVGDAELRTVGDLSNPSLKLEIYGDGAIYATTKAIEVNTMIKGLGKIEVKGNFKLTSVNKDVSGNMVTTYR